MRGIGGRVHAIILSASVAGLSVFSFGTSAESSTSLSIVSVSVTRPDPATCTYRWQASVRNDGTTQAGGTGTAVQAYQGSTAGDWAPASGTTVPLISPGGTQTSSAITFERLANKTLLKVQVYQASAVVAEKLQSLQAEPAPKLTLSNFSASDTTYAIDLVNLLQEGYPGVSIQAYAAKDYSSGWVPAGGIVVPCIAASGYRNNGFKPSGYGLVKVQVIRGSKVIVEQIFNAAALKAPTVLKAPTQAAPMGRAELTGFSIQAPVVARPDPVGCGYRWEATVRNNTQATTDGLTLQGYTQRNGWVESGAGGRTLPNLAAGASSQQSSGFDASELGTYVYLAIEKSGQRLAVGPKTPLPPRPRVEDALAVVGKVSATSFGVSVRNRLAEGYPGFDLTLEVSTSSSPQGPWSRPEVLLIKKCIRGNTDTESLTRSKPADQRYVKVDVIRWPPPGGPRPGEPPWPAKATVLTRVLEPSLPIKDAPQAPPAAVVK